MSPLPSDAGGWKTAAQIEAGLRSLQADRPDLCQITALDPPPTVGGRSIIMLRVASPVGAAPKIPVLITGGMHAREWAPPDALLDFADRLVHDGVGAAPAYTPKVVAYTPFDKFPVSPRPVAGGKLQRLPTGDPPAPFPRVTIAKSALKTIFEKLEIFIVPLVNVDGRTFSISGTTHGQQYWRKNRQPNPGATCVDGEAVERGIGTDLNRNFDVAWDIKSYYSEDFLAKLGPDGNPVVAVATDPCPPPPFTARKFEHFGQYHGSAPESAPEAKRLADLIRNKNIRYFLDVHSADGSILYPFSMGHPSNDPTKNYRNTNLDAKGGPPRVGGRRADGLPGDAEFVPDTLLATLRTTAGRMRDGIRHMSTPDPRGADRESELSSKYTVKSSLGLYPATGAIDDYAFSRQFTPPVGPTFATSATPPNRLAFTIECGRSSEGDEDGFFPSRTHEYRKIAREVHMACWALLSYAAAPARDATPTWPIKTG